MVAAVTSPPVASRTYAYASIAAYEALRPSEPDYFPLSGQLPDLTAFPEPDPEVEYLPELASVAAFLSVAEALVFRPDMVAEHRAGLLRSLREHGVPAELVDRSVDYGDAVGRHILAWAGTDNIGAARAAIRYEVRLEPGRWVPTPPAYMPALEPNWGTLRPFAMLSPDEFSPPPPVPYDLTAGSPFRGELMAVYDAVGNLTKKQREICLFWDDNPYAVQSEGHFMYAVKKASPGGHWMGITTIALRAVDAAPMEAADAYARVAMALADGFISAWDEKFRSNLVRPETVINEEIDPEWRPVLQTPPFPEYSSGHSVISTAAAEVLTAMLGDGFAFDDTTEAPYGLPVRSFSSFREAAAEAAISRLYGGIHYPMAIDHGIVQGRSIGNAVLERVRTREPRIAAANR